MNMACARRFKVLWVAATMIAACGGGDDPSAQSPSVGTVLEERTLTIGETAVDVTMQPGVVAATRVIVPVAAVTRKQEVVVRVSSGVMKTGAMVANGTTFQVATSNVTFSATTPARMQQRVPATPPPGKRYAAVAADEGAAAWVEKGTVRVVPTSEAGAPAAVGSTVTIVIEINVLGSGLWAIGLVDVVAPGVDGGVDAAPIAGDAGVDAAAVDGSPVRLDAAGGDVVVRTDGSTVGMDAAPGVDASLVVAPTLKSLLPTGGSASQAATIAVSGAGFVTGAQGYFDGKAVPTTVTSDASVLVEVAADLTVNPGQLAIWVNNRAGDVRTRSNTLYYAVSPVPGAPVVLDYSPDNGVVGDKILIVASNLVGQTLTIKDAAGHVATPGMTGTIGWVGQGAEFVEFILPADFVTGPITVGNPLGTFRGKTFNVGQNLTRLPGTVLDASSEYNTTNWSKKSGGDNDLRTSFFTANGDCASNASCTKKPVYWVTFAEPQVVGRIAMRGNREYPSGYDFLRGRFEVLDAQAQLLWTGVFDLPGPDRDLDIFLPAPVAGATVVRFSSEADESIEPGFSELEVFGP